MGATSSRDEFITALHADAEPRGAVPDPVLVGADPIGHIETEKPGRKVVEYVTANGYKLKAVLHDGDDSIQVALSDPSKMTMLIAIPIKDFAIFCGRAATLVQ